MFPCSVSVVCAKEILYKRGNVRTVSEKQNMSNSLDMIQCPYDLAQLIPVRDEAYRDYRFLLLLYTFPVVTDTVTIALKKKP